MPLAVFQRQRLDGNIRQALKQALEVQLADDGVGDHQDRPGQPLRQQLPGPLQQIRAYVDGIGPLA